MIIKIYYKNGNQDIFDTKELTESGSISPTYKNVMTKFHISWDDFLKDNFASHLNIYIYYYRKDNDQGSKITATEYLDDILFYDNDRQIYRNLSPEEVKQKHKDLPYGSMEPGTWFTLVPYENKKDVLEIEIDGTTRLYRPHEWHDLVDIYKFNYLADQYLNREERSLDFGNKVDILFNKLKDVYIKEDATIAIDETDIANEMEIPYQLIIQIKERITIIGSKETESKQKETEEILKTCKTYLNKSSALGLINFIEEFLLVLRNWLSGSSESSNLK